MKIKSIFIVYLIIERPTGPTPQDFRSFPKYKLHAIFVPTVDYNYLQIATITAYTRDLLPE